MLTMLRCNLRDCSKNRIANPQVKPNDSEGLRVNVPEWQTSVTALPDVLSCLLGSPCQQVRVPTCLCNQQPAVKFNHQCMYVVDDNALSNQVGHHTI